MNESLAPWFVALIANEAPCSRVPTLLEDRMLAALARAVHDPKHAIYQRTFGFYRPTGAKKEEQHEVVSEGA
jgi:hypothetical protein